MLRLAHLDGSYDVGTQLPPCLRDLQGEDLDLMPCCTHEHVSFIIQYV